MKQCAQCENDITTRAGSIVVHFNGSRPDSFHDLEQTFCSALCLLAALGYWLTGQCLKGKPTGVRDALSGYDMREARRDGIR